MEIEKGSRSQNLIKVMDPYLPPGVKDNAGLSLEGLIRARVLTAILVYAVAATVISFIGTFITHLVTDLDFKLPAVTSFVSFFVMGGNYWYFYKSGNSNSAGILFSLCFFMIVVGCILLSGGYHSPVKPLMLAIPVVAFLINGRQEGIYNAILVLAVMVALIILKLIGFEVLQLADAEIIPYLTGMVWLVTVFLIVICLYFYDVLLEDKRSIRVKQ